MIVLVTNPPTFSSPLIEVPLIKALLTIGAFKIQAAIPVASPSKISIVLVKILAPPTKPPPMKLPLTGMPISGAAIIFWSAVAVMRY